MCSTTRRGVSGNSSTPTSEALFSPLQRSPAAGEATAEHTCRMTDTITLTGFVATVPNHLVTGEGLPITSFRLASTQRRFDRSRNQWVDNGTNWYTVTTFRQLALNTTCSIKKGERVLVTGRLRIRDWAAGDKVGTSIEIDADSIGPDLTWGTASFTRSMSTAAIDTATRVETDAVVPDPSDANQTSDAPSASSIDNGWPTATPGLPEKADSDPDGDLVGATVQGEEAPF
jgi:single-strand DNA-binding protein